MAQHALTWPQRVIRWGFERFYREFAWTYDPVAALVSGGNWRRWALSVLPELRGHILELGCGPGHLQRALAERGASAVGLDRSAQMIGHSAAQLLTLTARPALTRADIRALPLANAAFDTVVATFPTEQIAAPETLSEVRRVLRPGGRFVVLLAARMHGAGPYQRLVDLAYRVTLQRPASPSPPNPLQARHRQDAKDTKTESARVETFDPSIERYLGHIRAAGFVVAGGWRPVPGGIALVLIAERP